MSLPKDDIALLIDIYECTVNIFELVKGMKAYHFEKDKKTRWAVERQFEIIGVASQKISNETRDLLPQIPWSGIIGLRNVIAHDYAELIIAKIWYTIKNSLPTLKKELQKIEDLKEYINKN